MTIHIEANLDLEFEGHRLRLTSSSQGLELAIPSLAAGAALLGMPGADQMLTHAEQGLRQLGQTVRVTYRGVTLISLGAGVVTLMALRQALQWLR